MHRLVVILTAATLLTGCATVSPPPLTPAHPASPDAPESAPVARQTSLRPDETTRKSHALLSAAKQEQERWNASGPVSGTPDDAPKTGGKMEMKNMEMNHEH